MMALYNNYFLFSQPPFVNIDWEPQFSGFGDELNNMTPELDFPALSDASTGYLEDALVQWSRKRRFDSSNIDTTFISEDISHLLQEYANSACYEDSNILNFQNDSNVSGIRHGENLYTSFQQDLCTNVCSTCVIGETAKNMDEIDTRNSDDQKFHCFIKGKEPVKQESERSKCKIMYPFALVKPIGLDGDVTLQDINERMQRPPTRPVKHPVGEYAFDPFILGHGPRLSGKTVVGLARIHTQGRGTITVIRTRG